MMISMEEHRQRMRLYDKGLNDARIAEALYMVPGSIRYWRRINALPPNNPRKRVDYTVMDRLISEGLTGRVIAGKMDCHIKTVYARMARIRKGWV